MRSGKQLHFFATRYDLESVCADLEREWQIAYLDRSPSRNSSSIYIYSSFTQINDAGVAPFANAIAGYAYLMVPAGTKLTAAQRSSPNQLSCPDSIVFMPGGRWHNDVLLYGKIATISSSRFSSELYRFFARLLKKRFKKVRAYWVGPEAYGLGRSGIRLTIGGNSPREYDLRLPDE